MVLPYRCCTGSNCKQVISTQQVVFLPGAEEKAIELAALDIMKQLCKEDKITEQEQYYIAKKRNIHQLLIR
ncbi:hypothetical protein [Pseudobutyrivibrio sp. YE44]|uniref:hypothetical protein n=1 Tax=Pseudobutyrivibrio sp. YE44 TaxID=1520802 RepID=UPI00115FB86D|nr:hypothetical protein [Pseudobutyrivibrio sp. YE44]